MTKAGFRSLKVGDAGIGLRLRLTFAGGMDWTFKARLFYSPAHQPASVWLPRGAFAQAGAKLALVARSVDTLTRFLADELRESGSEAIAIRADLRDPAQVKYAVEEPRSATLAA